MPRLLNSLSRFTALASLPALLLSISLPIRPAVAWNQFDVCVTELSTNGVDSQKAGVACSDALIPKELSLCVSRIKARTPIEPVIALDACYRVRRPVDLANCVVDVQAEVVNSAKTESKSSSDAETVTWETLASQPIGEIQSPSNAVLVSCQRSLLPGRHSECVIALSRDVQDTTPMKAMETCLSAEDFPRDLFPAYIPQ